MAHEVQSRELLHSLCHEQDQTHRWTIWCYFIHGLQLNPATDYLPKPKHRQSGNHGSTTTHLTNTAKYLGVYINSKLSWNHHVDAITKKASSTMWFLNRNPAHCSRDDKKYCYQTYIRTQLEYASTVQNPHTKVNTNKLETVQRNAARNVFQDFSRHSNTANFNGPAWNNIDSWLGLLWCTKSSMVSLTFGHIIVQGLVAAMIIQWHYNSCVAGWSHMKPASSQLQWFHGTDSQPQQWPHQALILSRPRCWKLFACSHLCRVFIHFYLQLTVLHNIYDFTVSTPWCVHSPSSTKRDKYWQKNKRELLVVPASDCSHP